MQPSFPNNFFGFIWKSTCMLQWATILLCKLLSSLGLVFLLSLVAVDDFLLHYVVKFSCLSIFWTTSGLSFLVKSVSLRQAKTKRSEKIDVSALHRTLEAKCTKHRTPTFHTPPNFSLSRNYMTHIDWQLWLLKPTSISLLFYILFFSVFVLFLLLLFVGFWSCWQWG